MKVTRPDVGPSAPGILRRRSRSRLSGRDRATPPRFSDGVDAIDRAAESPYELGAIPLRVADLAFGEASSDKAVVMLVVEADLRAFGFATAARQVVRRPGPARAPTELGERHRTLRAQSRDVVHRGDALRAGILASAVAGVPPETGTLPGEGRGNDANSGRIGSVTHDFVVPSLTGLRLTTPILTDAIEAPSFGSQSPPKPVLIARRAFPAGATLYYQFSVLGAGKDAAGTTRVVGSHQLIGPAARWSSSSTAAGRGRKHDTEPLRQRRPRLACRPATTSWC